MLEADNAFVANRDPWLGHSFHRTPTGPGKQETVGNRVPRPCYCCEHHTAPLQVFPYSMAEPFIPTNPSIASRSITSNGPSETPLPGALIPHMYNPGRLMNQEEPYRYPSTRGNSEWDSSSSIGGKSFYDHPPILICPWLVNPFQGANAVYLNPNGLLLNSNGQFANRSWPRWHPSPDLPPLNNPEDTKASDPGEISLDLAEDVEEEQEVEQEEERSKPAVEVTHEVLQPGLYKDINTGEVHTEVVPGVYRVRSCSGCAIYNVKVPGVYCQMRSGSIVHDVEAQVTHEEVKPGVYKDLSTGEMIYDSSIHPPEGSGLEAFTTGKRNPIAEADSWIVENTNPPAWRRMSDKYDPSIEVADIGLSADNVSYEKQTVLKPDNKEVEQRNTPGRRAQTPEVQSNTPIKTIAEEQNRTKKRRFRLKFW